MQCQWKCRQYAHCRQLVQLLTDSKGWLLRKPFPSFLQVFLGCLLLRNDEALELGGGSVWQLRWPGLRCLLTLCWIADHKFSEVLSFISVQVLIRSIGWLFKVHIFRMSKSFGNFSLSSSAIIFLSRIPPKTCRSLKIDSLELYRHSLFFMK